MSTDGANRDFSQVLKQSFDEASNSLRVLGVGSLVPLQYDDIQLSYTGANLTTVIYKDAGLTVATLTLSYSGSQLIEVARS